MIREWGNGISIAEDPDGRPFAAICIDAASFLANGAELMRRAPVKALDLGNAGSHMAELVTMPAFQQMTRLVLHDLGDAGAAILGGARLAVRELVAIDCGLTKAAPLGRLATQLEVLELSKNAVPDLATLSLDHLARLALANCRFDAVALAGAHLKLKALELSGNRLTAAELSALARAAWAHKLERLDLARTLIGDAGAKIVATLAAPGPIDLDLRGDALEDPAAIQALASAPWSRLQRIGLSANLVKGEAMESSYDYDGSVVARVPVLLSPAQIADRFGFGKRGVTVY